MTSNRKALFFDIDGTLLSEVNRNVPESAKRAVAKARANGHLVFINSGRTYSLIGPIKGLVEVDGYCCGCGTRVIVDDEVLFSFTIPHERGLQIKKDILKYNMEGILEGTEHCYLPSWNRFGKMSSETAMEHLIPGKMTAMISISSAYSQTSRAIWPDFRGRWGWNITS